LTSAAAAARMMTRAISRKIASRGRRMSNKNYHFKIGDFACTVVSDGIITVPDPDAPPGSFQPGAGKGNPLDVLSLLVTVGDRKILIDTGCGTDMGPMGKDAGLLVRNLRDEKVAPEDVDIVVISHAHSDHIAGNIDSRGNPTFPRARYVMLKKEWDFWEGSLNSTIRNPNKNPNMLAIARKQLIPLESRMDLVENNGEAVPGMKLQNAPGHTPGSALIILESGTERLVVLGDLIHHPIELSRPDYYKMFDHSPAQAIRSRNKVLGDAARRGDLVFSPHFPFPGLGRVEAVDGIFKWRPVQA
jgi:glyoxylase-like metal-dependent hydrolase (beta-lactamase superfamily II)